MSSPHLSPIAPRSPNTPPAPPIWPAPLLPGDPVYVVAPASAYDAAALAAGVALLEARGLRVVVPGAMLQPQFHYAAPAPVRAALLGEALRAPRPGAIWAVRGGAGSAQLLPLVDALGPAALAAAPRWLVGFSDITALHARFQAAGVVSLHGANVCSLPSWGAPALDALFGLLRGEPGPALEGRAAASQSGAVTGAGRVRGRLVGGNLTVLASLCGTGALGSWEGAILVLEDIAERPYRLDRCLHQLEAAGQLRGVRGVALGQLSGCDDARLADTAEQVLGARLAALGLPMVSGLPIGHDDTSWAVPLGAEAELDLTAGTLRVLR